MHLSTQRIIQLHSKVEVCHNRAVHLSVFVSLFFNLPGNKVDKFWYIHGIEYMKWLKRMKQIYMAWYKNITKLYC